MEWVLLVLGLYLIYKLRQVIWLVIVLLLVALCFVLAMPSRASASEHEPSDEPPSTLSAEYWVTSQIDKQHYEASRTIATVGWEVNRVLMLTAETFAELRSFVHEGFQPILDEVGGNLLPYGRLLLVIALALGGLALMARHIFHVHVVDLRLAAIMLVCLPLFLGGVSMAFEAVDRFRSDLGGYLYQLSFNMTDSRSHRIPSYYGGSGRQAIDVSASYLFATRQDVNSDVALPDAFERTYFPPEVPADWSELSARQRQTYIRQADSGAQRMWFGVPMALLAIAEAALHTLWTIGTAVAFLGLLFSALVVSFTPFSASVRKHAQLVAGMVLGAGMISVLQGLLVALLFSAAETGTASRVLAMALMVGFFDAAMLISSLLFVGSAVWMAFDSITPDAATGARAVVYKVWRFA